MTRRTAARHVVLEAPASWAKQDANGETITVTIDETTFHPGHDRVVLSATGPLLDRPWSPTAGDISRAH
jgi:hypothetical protein